MLATAVANTSVLLNSTNGELLDKWPGHIIVAIGIITVFSLFAGWWFRSINLMNTGLLLSTGVWASAAFILIYEREYTPGLISLCWSISSTGAWLLEMDHARRRSVK